MADYTIVIKTKLTMGEFPEGEIDLYVCWLDKQAGEYNKMWSWEWDEQYLCVTLAPGLEEVATAFKLTFG